MHGRTSWTKIGFILLLTFSSLSAQTGGSYNLSWNSLGSGGQMFSSGGSYRLGGTIGQGTATTPMVGGTFTLVGGFWAAPATYQIYTPSIMK
jgi:hypothetical protein